MARFEDDDVWLTQEHLARLYNTSKQNVSQHLKSIFESGELDAETKVKKFFTMGKKEGQVAERPIYHYCLDVIIALGYRIDSPVAIRFRQWATERLHELIQKGFALEDERLKQGGNRYFKELLQRIRSSMGSDPIDTGIAVLKASIRFVSDIVHCLLFADLPSMRLPHFCRVCGFRKHSRAVFVEVKIVTGLHETNPERLFGAYYTKNHCMFHDAVLR